MYCPHLRELITKKRDGEILDAEEIDFFVNSVKKTNTSHNESQRVPDPSQIGSMLMAMYLRGMNDEETRNLTTSMKNSGFVFSWPNEWKHLVVDKHSTGGVGDKISLVLVPALAAVGLKVPMISGRSLGHTGGTLDKLESIPGFCVERTVEEIKKQVEDVGCCIVGQTDEINPADKIIYRARDITATVEQPSLITASIVSKKLAEGLSGLVYDVKFGKGSMFRSEDKALEMAKRLVLASSHETKCCAVFTAMDSPIGSTIGNTLEVLEAVESLRGEAPVDILELVEEIGSELMCLTGLEGDATKAKEKIRAVLNNGKALEKFYRMLKCQGVSEETASMLCFRDAEQALPKAAHTQMIAYNGPAGYVNDVDASILACTWKWMMESSSTGNNLTAGFVLKKHVGDEIESGDKWLEIHFEQALDKGKIEALQNALEVSEKITSTRKRVHKRIYLNECKLEVNTEL